MSRFERPADFYDAHPYAAPSATSVKSIVLLVALLAYAVGFAILYPVSASSAAKSVAHGDDPAPIQFVGP